jgi:hypothetical protein
VAALVITSSPARGQNLAHQQQIKQHEQKLAEVRAAKSRAGEAAGLLLVGSLYSQAGQKQKGLDSFTQALSVERELGNRVGEAAALDSIGSVYNGRRRWNISPRHCPYCGKWATAMGKRWH